MDLTNDQWTVLASLAGLIAERSTAWLCLPGLSSLILSHESCSSR
jgi:hypothetical protein